MRYIYDRSRKERGLDPWVLAEQYVPPARTYVIQDTIDAFQSQADGKTYESKSQYRQSLKAQGMVELGNDRIERKKFEPTITERDVARALAEHGHSTV
jgi:hypothetical protein